MPSVEEGLTGADYSGAASIDTDEGFEAALRAKVAAKQSDNSSAETVKESSERYDPDRDSGETVKAQVHADVPTLDVASAITYGDSAPEPRELSADEIRAESAATIAESRKIDPEGWKRIEAQKAQATEDRTNVLYREFIDACNTPYEPQSFSELLGAYASGDDADTADPVIRAAANLLQGVPAEAEEFFEQSIAEEFNKYYEQWGEDAPEITDSDTEAGQILAQARDLIAEERAQVEALRNEENRTKAQATAYEGSRQAAKAWAREQGVRSSAEADQRIAAAAHFLASELGVNLEALMYENPAVFKSQLELSDAALRGIESEDRVQRFKSEMMSAHTTNVSEGLETDSDRLERLLKRIAPDPVEPSRELDKAMTRAELRANGHSQTGASIKAEIMGADSETAVKHGFTRGGRKVSQEEATFDPEREAELRRERVRAAGIR